jgi:hypothetical protein
MLTLQIHEQTDGQIYNGSEGAKCQARASM